MPDRRFARRVDALDLFEDPLSLELGERFAHGAPDDRAIADRLPDGFVRRLVAEFRTADHAYLRLGLAEELWDPGPIDPRLASQVQTGRGLSEGSTIVYREFLQQRRNVRLDRLLSDAELGGDFLVLETS